MSSTRFSFGRCLQREIPGFQMLRKTYLFIHIHTRYICVLASRYSMNWRCILARHSVFRRRIRRRGSQPTSSFNFMSYLKFFQKQRASYYSNGNIKDSYILKWLLTDLSSSVTKENRVWAPLISYPDPTI